MSDRREKQLEIVLKLNRLTKQGKLVWSKVALPITAGGTAKYVSEFKDRWYHLTDSPRWATVVSVNTPTISPNTLRFSLYIKGNSEDEDIRIPPMPAVDDLASTVHHQIKPGDSQDLDEVLRDLEEAENLLEE